MGDQGLYPKYKIIKNSTGEEVTTPAFVLLPEKDIHARMAMLWYAKSVENSNPTLANELRDWIWSLPNNDGS